MFYWKLQNTMRPRGWIVLLLLLLISSAWSSHHTYPWSAALEAQLRALEEASLGEPQSIIVVHLGITDRDERALDHARELAESFGRPVIALPSYTGNPKLDLGRSAIQYLNSGTYKVEFEKAWQRILDQGHTIDGLIFHSGAGLRANSECKKMAKFVRNNPGKITGNVVFAMTDLKGRTKKAFAEVGLNAVQIGPDDLVSWATKPARRYIPFGEYLGPVGTAMGTPLKPLFSVGKGLSRHSLLDRKDELVEALGITSTVDEPEPSDRSDVDLTNRPPSSGDNDLSQRSLPDQQDEPAEDSSAISAVAGPDPPDRGGVDFSAMELRYMAEFDEDSQWVLNAAFRATLSDSEVAINPAGAADLSWDAFFVRLSLPREKFWVNLNPSEPDRIIDSELGKTDVGRIMLVADLQLKRDLAQLLHPTESSFGPVFWQSLWDFAVKGRSADERDSIAIPTSFRFWVIPKPVDVWVTDESFYVIDAPLDVKLESEYIEGFASQSGADPTPMEYDSEIQEYAESLILRDVLPQLVDRVNNAPEYRELRQIYYSLVVADWYKTRHTSVHEAFEAVVGQRRADDWTARKAWNSVDVFNEFVRSLQEGEYNVVKMDTTISGNMIYIEMRQYFMGGVDFSEIAMKPVSYDSLLTNETDLPDRLFDALYTLEGYAVAHDSVTTWWLGGTFVAPTD